MIISFIRTWAKSRAWDTGRIVHDSWDMYCHVVGLLVAGIAANTDGSTRLEGTPGPEYKYCTIFLSPNPRSTWVPIAANRIIPQLNHTDSERWREYSPSRLAVRCYSESLRCSTVQVTLFCIQHSWEKAILEYRQQDTAATAADATKQNQ